MMRVILILPIAVGLAGCGANPTSGKSVGGIERFEAACATPSGKLERREILLSPSSVMNLCRSEKGPVVVRFELIARVETAGQDRKSGAFVERIVRAQTDAAPVEVLFPEEEERDRFHARLAPAANAVLSRQATEDRALGRCRECEGGMTQATAAYNRRDAAGAAKQWQELCDRDHGQACYRLGWLYDRPAPKESAEQKQLGQALREACKQRSEEACKILRNADEEKDRGVGRNPKKAADLFGKACELGAGDGCNALGERADRDRKGHAKALALYEKACDANSKAGCGNLGLARLKDRPGDPASALELVRQGCDLEAFSTPLPKACVELMRRAAKGEDLGDGAASAERYARAACSNSEGEGCHFLAKHGDPKARLSNLRLGCENGHQPACREEAKLDCDRYGTPQSCDKVGGGPQ